MASQRQPSLFINISLRNSIDCAILLVFGLLINAMTTMTSSHAQLNPNFCDTTCPAALDTIRTSIRTAISKEPRMAASLIRLHFHDCFVQGCDASILLSGGEQDATPNIGSTRGYDVIEAAKAEVEKICPGVVSCADILAVAARDASVAAGSNSWTVKLGRRDSNTSNPDQANADLPSFDSPLETLIAKFEKKGLSVRDMVALSGAHTLGQAQCKNFRDRIYSNASNIDAEFASTRKQGCPNSGGDTNLAALDVATPDSFDNNYYKNLMQKKGLLTSDQVLFNGGSTDEIVSEYSTNPATFMSDYATAMIKMADIEPLTGSQGQIRRICCAAN